MTERRFEELFHPETGRTYKEFWEKVAETKEGAYFGVAGRLFDQPLDDEDMDVDGEPVSNAILEALEVGPGDSVLEIGVGVGRIAQHVAPRCGRFVGVDISANMIEVARERLSGVEGEVELVALDASGRLPFEDASLDRVYCQIVLIHLDREEVFRYLREACRVLKPGGRAWFQTNNLLHPTGWKLFVAIADQVDAQGQPNRGRVHCLTNRELRAYVEGAGLVIDEERSHLEESVQQWGFVVPSLQWEHYLVAVAEKPRA